MNLLKKKWMIAIPVAVVLIGGASLLHWWQSAATTSTVTSMQPTGDVLSSSVSLRLWYNVYFSSEVPSFLTLRTSNENPNAPQLGSYVFGNTNFRRSDQLSVTLGALVNSTVGELPAVRLRQNQPANYQLSSRSFARAVQLSTTGSVVMKQAYFGNIIVSMSVLSSVARPNREANLMRH